MSGPNAATSPNAKALAYNELNPGHGKTTILLIHGAGTTGNEWDVATPHLSPDYHLLLPDLPAHGKSKDIVPYSKKLAASLLANLVEQRAHNGKAYVVGFSMGAHVAIELISKYPHLVDVAFISGYEVFSSPNMLTYGLWIQNAVVPSLVPKAVMRWFMGSNEDVTESSNETNSNFALCRSIAESLCFGDDQWPSPWPARTLIVAAGKRGILPTADHPDDAKRLRDIAGRAQPTGQTKAYTHPEMIHPWNAVAPELFAKTARMWYEEGKVPQGFREL